MLETSTLALRPGETRQYFDHEPDDPHYIVALVNAPAFPAEGHEKSKPLGVMCAQRYRVVEGGDDRVLWGWVHLTADTKSILGRDLYGRGAKPGRWYYLVISH